MLKRLSALMASAAGVALEQSGGPIPAELYDGVPLGKMRAADGLFPQLRLLMELPFPAV